MRKDIMILLLVIITLVTGNKAIYASASGKDHLSPGRVRIVASSKGVSKVKLRWKTIKDADGYKVYIKQGSRYKCIKTIRNGSINTYKKQDLKSGTTYRFKVRAYKKRNGKVLFGRYSAAKKLTTKYGLSKGHYSNEYFSFDFDPTFWEVDECYDDSIRIKQNARPGESEMSWEEQEKIRERNPRMSFSHKDYLLFHGPKRIDTINEYLDWEFKDWEDIVDDYGNPYPKHIKYKKVKIAGKTFIPFGNKTSFVREYVTLVNGKYGKRKFKVPIHIGLNYISSDHRAYNKKYYNKVLKTLKINDIK